MQMLFCSMIRRGTCTTKKWNKCAKTNTKQQQWERKNWKEYGNYQQTRKNTLKRTRIGGEDQGEKKWKNKLVLELNLGPYLDLGLEPTSKTL